MTGSPPARTGPAASPPALMPEEEFRTMYDRLRSHVPWGPDDRRGALNYLTPAEARAAAGEVKLGRTVSLENPVENRPGPDNPEPARHEMKGTLGADAGPGVCFGLDVIQMNIHGNADTHIDALCHVMFDGILHNGVPAATVGEHGASEMSIDVAADGIVGRGVMLDIPRVRGVQWLEPGDSVTVDDVLAAERDQGVKAGKGDILCVRVGHRRRRKEEGPWDVAQSRSGLHPSVLPLLAERQIAVLASDGNNDTAPSPVDGVDFPVHVLAVNALGVHLIDYMNLTALATTCAEVGRWSFQCVIAPLRLPTGTGSPVNPIAIL